MSEKTIWELLEIAPASDKREIRAAYVRQAKFHHPEEDPEGFAELNNAYQQALQYAKTRDGAEPGETGERPAQKSREDKAGGEARPCQRESGFLAQAKDSHGESSPRPAESLLARLEIKEQKKIKKSREQGALGKLAELLEKPEDRKDRDSWKAYFLSESFLSEQLDEQFGRGLVQYLKDQYGLFDPVSREDFSERSLPPRPFVTELAIAYGLYPDTYGNIDGDGSFYNRMVAGRIWNACTPYWNFPVKTPPEKVLNPKDFRVQDNPELMEKYEKSLISGPERILMRAENLVRLRSFLDYLTLQNMDRQGYLTEKERKLWEPVLDCGQSNHLYEKNGRKAVYPETRSTTVLALYAHWVNTKKAPFCVCRYMYQKYDLRNLEHSSGQHLYAPLKTAILKCFPNMEELLFGKDSKEQKIRNWYQECMQIISDCQLSYERREYEEPESVKSRVSALFAHKEWREICHEPDLFDRMYLQIVSRKVMPVSLAEKLCAFYQEEYPWPNPREVQRMQESLTASLAYHRSLIEEDYRHPYVYEKTEVSDIDGANRDFWEYFLMAGLGCRSYCVVSSVQDQDAYAAGNQWYLPAYMQAVYLPSLGWRRRFTGFDQEENAVLNPKSLEFFLPGRRSLRAEFHFHYIRYFLDGVPVIYPAFTFAETQKMVQDGQVADEHIFFLLAVTSICDEERQTAETEILRWLKKLPLAPATLPVLAKMIAADNDHPLLPENEARRIQAVFYEEQERFCFKAEVFTRGLKTYRKTNFGWVEMPLLGGEGKAAKALDLDGKKRYAIQKLASLRQPKPALLCSYSLEGLSGKARMRRVIDALKEQEQYRKKRTHPYAPGFPWSPEEITPAVREFFARDGGWMLESYVLLQMGEQQAPCFERIFYSKMNIFGFDLSFQSPEFTGILNTRTYELSRKIRENHLVAGHFGWGKAYDDRKSYGPMPFAIGESGMFYGCDALRLYKEDSLEGLMEKLFDFSEVSRVDIYKGRLSVSRLDRELEYCYTEEDFEEYLHSKTKTLPDVFTKFGI